MYYTSIVLLIQYNSLCQGYIVRIIIDATLFQTWTYGKPVASIPHERASTISPLPVIKPGPNDMTSNQESKSCPKEEKHKTKFEKRTKDQITTHRQKELQPCRTCISIRLFVQH